MRFIGNGQHAAVCLEIARLMMVDRRVEGIFIAIGDNRNRAKEARAALGPFVRLIHPSAIVSSTVDIGEGTVLMAGSIVQANARIGKHCIINTGATVDHDCIVEDYAHIAPGAHLCGGVHVGEGALVGVSVGLEPGTHVPAWHIVKRNGYRVERARDF